MAGGGLLGDLADVLDCLGNFLGVGSLFDGGRGDFGNFLGGRLDALDDLL